MLIFLPISPLPSHPRDHEAVTSLWSGTYIYLHLYLYLDSHHLVLQIYTSRGIWNGFQWKDRVRSTYRGARKLASGLTALDVQCFRPGCTLPACSGVTPFAQSYRAAPPEPECHLGAQTPLWPVPSCLLWSCPWFPCSGAIISPRLHLCTVWCPSFPVFVGDSCLRVTYSPPTHVPNQKWIPNPGWEVRCVPNLAISSLSINGLSCS